MCIADLVVCKKYYTIKTVKEQKVQKNVERTVTTVSFKLIGPFLGKGQKISLTFYANHTGYRLRLIYHYEERKSGDPQLHKKRINNQD